MMMNARRLSMLFGALLLALPGAASGQD